MTNHHHLLPVLAKSQSASLLLPLTILRVISSKQKSCILIIYALNSLVPIWPIRIWQCYLQEAQFLRPPLTVFFLSSLCYMLACWHIFILLPVGFVFVIFFIWTSVSSSFETSCSSALKFLFKCIFLRQACNLSSLHS